MRVRSLCYHDVIREGAYDSSGFTGGLTTTYKLEAGIFRLHLAAIEEEVMARRSARRPGNVLDLLSGIRRGGSCLLTFDDGGSSALATIAPILEDFGWRGHFFIITNYIDAPGFLTRQQIRELHSRGHVIGTHSCSHRGRMSAQPPERLIQEWGISKEILSGLVGEEVITAAAPSGSYSRRVVEAAAIVGLRALFTLEPTARVESHGGCSIFGRYLIKRGMEPSLAGKLAVGRAYPCAMQWLSWNARKLAKLGLGPVYPRIREAYFSWQRSAP